jgi:septal ring factor EnvC (AmiA/AmiB activator)
MKKLLFIIVVTYLVGMQFYGRPYVGIQETKNQITELQNQQEEIVEQRFQCKDTIPSLKDTFLKTDTKIIEFSAQLEKRIDEFRKLPFCSNF